MCCNGLPFHKRCDGLRQSIKGAWLLPPRRIESSSHGICVIQICFISSQGWAGVQRIWRYRTLAATIAIAGQDPVLNLALAPILACC